MASFPIGHTTEMKKLLEELFSCINGDKATHEFMETEILKLAKDAERYRFIRRRDSEHAEYLIGLYAEKELDEKIDE